MGSDHHLVQADLKLRLRSGGPQCQTRLDRYSENLLRGMDVAKNFTMEVNDRFPMLSDQYYIKVEATIKEKWNQPKKAYKTARFSVSTL